ncbi:MAG TPA: acyl-ACP thioesterase domain-containing protein [Bacteroidales bacterium]|nr:acyl-ACP thioesterase domain-containing protein [Bacteroidales bacterium]
MMEALKFRKDYRIHVYETGPGGKLSIFSLFNFMQDIASDHAESLGFGRNDLMKENWFWVLSRLYLEMSRWPEWEETITLYTWPNGTDRLFALRNFGFFDKDKRQIGGASSSWLVLDNGTRKIIRPENLLQRRNIQRLDNIPVRNPAKLEREVEQAEHDHCFCIKTSDLDINLHTNNAAYLRWIYDSYDFGFIMKNDPQSAEINYLAESKHGETVRISTSSDNRFFDHSIRREEDKKELCRVRIEWMEQNVR